MPKQITKQTFFFLVFFVVTLAGIWLLFGQEVDFWSNQTAFEKRKECEEFGNYVYQDFKARYGIENVETPEYAFNKTLDTCLVYLDYYIHNQEVSREVVIDSLTRKELTSYYWFSGKDAERARRDKEAFNNSKRVYFSGGVPNAQ